MNSIAFPTVRSYDPAFGYETTLIVLDGMRKMYEEDEDAIYYITVCNENYVQPPMPAGVEEGVIRGIYKYSSKDAGNPQLKVQLFGSGAILREVLKAQDILAEKYQVSSNVWSVTSYTELRRDAHAAARWNMLHPTATPRSCYLETVLAGETGPFIAASDYVRAVTEQIDPWVPGGLFAMGTDGFGRSELRAPLRRHFEVDAECVTVGVLYQLSKAGRISKQKVAEAIKELAIDPEKIDPLKA